MSGVPERARVLVVDDEVNVARALVELLGDAGYDATWAANAEEAMARLDTFAPDVILADVPVGAVAGLPLVNLVRGRAEGPAIAFMSASPPPRAFAGPWLAKPLDLDALFTEVRRLCEARRDQASLARGR